MTMQFSICEKQRKIMKKFAGGFCGGFYSITANPANCSRKILYACCARQLSGFPAKINLDRTAGPILPISLPSQPILQNNTNVAWLKVSYHITHMTSGTPENISR
jgi:hypothetical protein